MRLGRGTLANIDLITRVSPMPGGTYVATLSTARSSRSAGSSHASSAKRCLSFKNPFVGANRPLVYREPAVGCAWQDLASSQNYGLGRCPEQAATLVQSPFRQTVPRYPETHSADQDVGKHASGVLGTFSLVSVGRAGRHPVVDATPSSLAPTDSHARIPSAPVRGPPAGEMNPI